VGGANPGQLISDDLLAFSLHRYCNKEKTSSCIKNQLTTIPKSPPTRTWRAGELDVYWSR
jgi:hypothetical protein